jgi:hypothetical protein
MLTIEQIAKVAHEANRAYCAALGDPSQAPWNEAPEWQRRSAINGVAFTQSHSDAPPSASHDSWLAEKLRDGWRYGPVKDPDRKEHPCVVPYEQLPVAQQLKDHLFQAVVRALSR